MTRRTEPNLELFADPVWRLNNLYQITTKEGEVIPFKPTPYQQRIIDAVYKEGKKRILVLKARRMGMSTLIDLMAFDHCYWNQNRQASIVDLTQGDASEKLSTKCRFALEKLHPDIKKKPVADSNKQLAFSNGSTINAGKNARGGTNTFLHISEWGPISYEDPKRSEEIQTGAIPSADTGIIMVESTFKGGRGGHFYDLIKRSMETPDSEKTDKDFHFFFFAWFEDNRHTLEGDASQVDKETTEYLDEMEKELGVTFTPGQRLWYYKVKKEQGIFMFREYPTTPEEAFKAPIEGAIYGDLIGRIRSKGQIKPIIPDPSFPVYTSWDLGWSDFTAIWVFQLINREAYWLNYLEARHATAAEMANALRALDLPFTAHYLPHDGGAVKGGSGLSYKGELEKAGLLSIRIVPRTHDIWVGINQLRDLLPRSWFDRDGCQKGLEALEAYHTREIKGGAVISKEPVHDWSSHGCDAIRTAVEAVNQGMVRDSSSISRHAQLAKTHRGALAIPAGASPDPPHWRRRPGLARH